MEAILVLQDVCNKYTPTKLVGHRGDVYIPTRNLRISPGYVGTELDIDLRTLLESAKPEMIRRIEIDEATVERVQQAEALVKEKEWELEQKIADFLGQPDLSLE